MGYSQGDDLMALLGECARDVAQRACCRGCRWDDACGSNTNNISAATYLPGARARRALTVVHKEAELELLPRRQIVYRPPRQWNALAGGPEA